MNELPMKKIFAALDGPTRGPNLHSGPIGVLLNSCTDRCPVRFEPLHLPEEYLSDLLNNTDLSSDQLYLRDIIIAISSGDISESLANRSPGKLGYARWLTTTNRILRIYVTFENPSTDLKIVCNYIINVYARTWFSVKAKPHFYQAPIHIYNMINNAKIINDERINNILLKVINNNSYALHSENIICAMLTDTRNEVRLRAVKIIMRCRGRSNDSNCRIFIKPTINFNANNYFELIDQNGIWLESILTRHISNDCLNNYINSIVPIILFPFYPSHTQNVERHIRLVSQTSKTIVSPELRDARINITLIQRKLIPHFASKCNFVV